MQEKLQQIIDLMKELQSSMAEGPEDLSERLGRKKPDLEVVKVGIDAEPKLEGDIPNEELAEEELEGESPFEDEESPEDKLKSRLMKLRA